MWCLGTWFSGGLGSARLTVGLDDLKGLFQPKLFYDSMILYLDIYSTLMNTLSCLAQICTLHKMCRRFPESILFNH